MRLGEEPYMDVERRNDILLIISQGHEKEVRINEVLSSIPTWADRPFKDDQENLNANLKVYQTTNPIVQKLEVRLANEPGPIWKELTEDEKKALTNWTMALDNLHGYVNSYFPTETQKYIPQISLWLIAIGAFVTPLFVSNGDEALSLPFHFGPPALPPSIGPSRPSGSTAVATQSQRPGYSSSSFSKIPGVPRSSATPVQAEIMRPAVSTPPWRQSVLPAPTPASAPGPGSGSTGYRTFVRPLGPMMPVTPETTQAAATGAPLTSSNPHGPRIYPRFRGK